ncbi:MAG TPA: hypothetical protein VK689_16105, partial [Armatimonadota bacterium]|nr:hypothetical protein [Armatimonadota bacterium]
RVWKDLALTHGLVAWLDFVVPSPTGLVPVRIERSLRRRNVVACRVSIEGAPVYTEGDPAFLAPGPPGLPIPADSPVLDGHELPRPVEVPLPRAAVRGSGAALRQPHGRRTRRWVTGLAWMGGVTVACGIPPWLMLQVIQGLDYRCNKHPPAETFTRYFGTPPPGVWDLRATGHISLGGATVWMRFRADERTFSALTRNYRRLPANETTGAVQSLAEEGSISSPEKEMPGLPEEHRVRWHELKRIRGPEVYESTPYYGGYHSTLVLDRSRRLAYFYHWNQ